jgi:hypothetical protein
LPSKENLSYRIYKFKEAIDRENFAAISEEEGKLVDEIDQSFLPLHLYMLENVLLSMYIMFSESQFSSHGKYNQPPEIWLFKIQPTHVFGCYTL